MDYNRITTEYQLNVSIQKSLKVKVQNGSRWFKIV